MAFQVSPGIESKEIDNTNIVPATSTTVGAFAGHFNWGPVDEIVTVGSEKQLADLFGSPANGNNARSFLTAASFLKYSNSLRVARSTGSGALNAADANQILIRNKDHFDSISELGFIFSAKYPGDIGNSISVSFAHVAGTNFAAYNVWEYRDLFDGPPNKSLTAQEAGISTNDEIHVVIVDQDGLVSGTKGTILERYEGLSLGSNAKDENGASLYYKDVINTNSSFIYVNTLSAIFEDADQPITASSIFAVENSQLQSESQIILPFIQSVVTTTSYGGVPVETTTTLNQNFVIKSGYTGANGNNVRFNINKIDTLDAPVKDATAFIKYGVPVNGDAITIGTDTFVKASIENTGLGEFSTQAELVAQINTANIVGDAVSYGDYIVLTGAIAGAGSNGFNLEFNGDGTTEVSGDLNDGVAADSDDYVGVTVDAIDAASGYVTYNITVTDDSTAKLSSILRQLKIGAIMADSANISDISAELNGLEVTWTDYQTSTVIDVATIFTGVAGLNKIIAFAGGEESTFTNNTLLSTYNLLNGANGAVSSGNVIDSLQLFADKELVTFDFLFTEIFNSGQDILDSAVYEIANARKDILGCISAPIEIASLTSNTLKREAVIAKFDSNVYSSSSYIVFDQTPGYTYNKYNDTYVWVPLSGHMAGLCANSDLVADPWFSPAGFNRGQLKGIIKIAYNPTKTDRDDLYKKRINCIVSVPGEGIVLYGDKTALSKPSSFDRINVRRLFNVIKRSISEAAKYQLFELNDEFTRASFKNMIEPYLRDVQGRRGVTAFYVVCDETNNTPEVIDRNEFVGTIFVRPTRSINFISLQFVSTRTGIDFKEIVGS